MASIIKRKKAYSVVYNYTDENGNTKQKWETWHTHKEALKRKRRLKTSKTTVRFFLRTIRSYLIFSMILFPLMGQRNGAFPCMTARRP